MRHKSRILLVDDQAMVRTGLRRILETDGGLKVMGEAGSAGAALDLLGTGMPCDVAVVEISLPGPDGIWLTRVVRERFSHTRVLMLTMHVEEDVVRGAFEAGAHGYLPKTAIFQELLEAISTVSKTGHYLHPSLSMARTSRNGIGSLTEREREILYRAARGMTNLQISQELCLSLSTVKQELVGLYRRFKVTDRTQAIVHALNVGLIRH